MQYYRQCGVIPFYKMEGMVGHALMFSDCVFLIQRATANETEQDKIERKMVEITTDFRAKLSYTSVPPRLIILYFVDSWREMEGGSAYWIQINKLFSGRFLACIL